MAPFHWVLPATTSKENNYYIFQDSPTSTPSMALKSKLQVSRTTPRSVTSKQTRQPEWTLSTWHPGHPCLVWFFFPSNYPRKSHSLQGWMLIKHGFYSPALLLAGYKTLKKRCIVHDTHLFFFRNSLDSLHNARPYAMFLGNKDEWEKSFLPSCSKFLQGDGQGKQM